MSRPLLIIGDVHGCLEELDELLRLVEHKISRYRLIFVGDLLDRGPDPIGCLRRVRELGAESAEGNHEEKHLRMYHHEAKRIIDPNYKIPMRPYFAERLEQHKALTLSDYRWFEQLPIYINIPEFNLIVTHAGFAAHKPYPDQDYSKVVRTRWLDADTGKFLSLNDTEKPGVKKVYWTERWRGPENVVYGHAVHDFTSPRIDSSAGGVECIGIDTGCCFGGHLTGLLINPDLTRHIIKVKAKREYFPFRQGEE